MGKIAATALLGLLLAAPGAARASLAELEVYDRTAGRVLQPHEYRGQRHVAGTPGHEYELRLRNLTGERLLAVTSVDGVNVVTGETAAPDQGGYVLGPHESLSINGWRKSLDEVAAFYFTAHANSYAARTGRPFDVGVIGVALFREKRRCCDGFGDRERAEPQRRAEAPAAEDRAAPSAAEKSLGTGHGGRHESHARRTTFERASDQPDRIVALYYDSHDNLVAQGIIPRPRQHAWRGPRPFPGLGFVPDP
jgi:hypothetical protein